MSTAHKIAQEFNNESFDYGDLEETIGFISDNYYQIMDIYRVIVKQLKETEQIRKEAHNDLRVLREDEAKWEKTGKTPKGFDKEEHAKRKEYLTRLREAEFDIIYKGQPLLYDKLTHIIVNKMWLFKIIDVFDMKGRKRLAPIASKGISIFLWPVRKMMESTAKYTDSLEVEKYLKRQLKEMKKMPDMMKKKILKV